jgi:hypothetical protein
MSMHAHIYVHAYICRIVTTYAEVTALDFHKSHISKPAQLKTPGEQALLTKIDPADVSIMIIRTVLVLFSVLQEFLLRLTLLRNKGVLVKYVCRYVRLPFRYQ